jgi:hypothetical protein
LASTLAAERSRCTLNLSRNSLPKEGADLAFFTFAPILNRGLKFLSVCDPETMRHVVVRPTQDYQVIQRVFSSSTTHATATNVMTIQAHSVGAPTRVLAPLDDQLQLRYECLVDDRWVFWKSQQDVPPSVAAGISARSTVPRHE